MMHSEWLWARLDAALFFVFVVVLCSGVGTTLCVLFRIPDDE